MKILALIFLVTFASGISKAQIGSEEKENQFELEEETLQIHDSEAERKAAKEEAQHQEKLENERLRQLKTLQAQKKTEEAISQKQLALYQARIATAEKKRKGYEAEMARTESELAKLREKVSMQEAKAKNSEMAVTDAVKTLNAKKQEKIEIMKRDTQATRTVSSDEDKIRSLKLQYARLNMETRQLEGHLKMVEEVEAKKDLERARMERDVSSVKDRRKAASDAVRAHQQSN